MPARRCSPIAASVLRATRSTCHGLSGCMDGLPDLALAAQRSPREFVHGVGRGMARTNGILASWPRRGRRSCAVARAAAGTIRIEAAAAGIRGCAALGLLYRGRLL